MKVTLSLLSRNEFQMNPEEKRFNLDKCPFLRKKYGKSDVGYLLLISPNANPPGVIVDGSQKTVKINFQLFLFEFKFYFKKKKTGEMGQAGRSFAEAPEVVREPDQDSRREEVRGEIKFLF